jgi:phage terminase small subunit
MTDEKQLSKPDEVFVSEYLLGFNATAAYKKAHPKAKDTTAASNGWKLLRKTEIQDAIKARLDEVHMSANEALKLTADIARGDITEFITPFGNLDIDVLRKSGKGRLVKKIKQKTVTKIGKGDKDPDVEVLDTEIELYPADAALDKILKVHGKYSDAPTVNINMSWKEFVESANRSASNNNT